MDAFGRFPTNLKAPSIAWLLRVKERETSPGSSGSPRPH